MTLELTVIDASSLRQKGQRTFSGLGSDLDNNQFVGIAYSITYSITPSH